MKLIIGSKIVYVVQLIDDMIFTNILIEKVLCMCLVGLIVSLYYNTMCLCQGYLGYNYKANRMDQKQIAKPYLIACIVATFDPVQRTKN